MFCAVAALLALTLLPNHAGAAAPVIEGFPNYRPQTKCSPKAKPGTVMLANHLMRRYRGSGSLGISRSCRDGGVSEHKEGRAFDWALSARSKRDRHYAADFLQRVRKTDRFGRRGALGRRMGIMYLIWNDRIYSASRHYKGRRYLNAGCKSLKRCSASLRHRNHMHISLTRAAARKQTSWYSKNGAVRPAAKAKKQVQQKARPTRRARQHAHRVHRRAHHRAHVRQHRAHQRQHRSLRKAHHAFHRRHKAALHHAHRAHHRRHKAARHHSHRVHHRRHQARHRAFHRVLHRAHVRRHRANRHAHRVYHRHHRARPHRRHHRVMIAPRFVARQQADQQRLDTDALGADQSWSNVTDWSEDEITSTEAQ
jgi:hypothetical protein